MPRIPTYETQISPPASRVSGLLDPGIAAAPYGELAKVGPVIADFADKMLRARRVTDLSNARTSALREVTDFETGLAGRQDFENFEQEYITKIEDIKARAREELTDNVVYRAFESDFANLTIRKSVAIRNLANLKRIQFGRASYFNNMTALTGMLADADELTRVNIFDQARLDTAEAIAVGYLNAEEGTRGLHAFFEHAGVIEAMEDIRTDPGAFNPDDYPHIDPKTRIQLADNAKIRVKANAAEIERQKAKAKVLDKEALDAQREGWENQAFIDLENRELSFTEIVDSPLHPDKKRVWNKLLAEQAKANSKGIEAFKNTDDEYYWDMLEQVYAGMVDPNDVFPVEDKLSRKDAQYLRGIAVDVQDEAKKPELQLQKLAIDMGRKMIVKGTILTGFDAREVQDAYLFEHDLRAELAKETDPQRRLNMLTPGTKEYAVDRLVSPYLRTLNEQIADMAKQLENITEPGVIEEEPIAPEVFRAPIFEPEDRTRAIELLRSNNKLVNEKTIGIVIERMKVGESFNPEGSGYDYETAESAGMKRIDGHMGSLDPRTGMVLKGRKHPTWEKTAETEKELGNKIIKRNGRYYSVPE